MISAKRTARRTPQPEGLIFSSRGQAQRRPRNGGSPEISTLKGSSFPRQAFSLAESMIAITIVSGLVVVALNAAGTSRMGQQTLCQRGLGQLLAAELLSEILAQPYNDPEGPALLGLELGETTANRADFDDVDDYDGWAESPPQNKDGTVIPDRAGWRRAVEVKYVVAANLTQIAPNDTGIKRITVTLTWNGREMAVLVAVRTDHSEPFVELVPSELLE